MHVKCSSMFFLVCRIYIAAFLFSATGHSSYNICYYADSYDNAANSTACLVKNCNIIL